MEGQSKDKTKNKLNLNDFDSSEALFSSLKRKRSEENESSDSDENSSADSDEDILSRPHKEVLKNLKYKDPEFFEYLQSNDAELLKFDDDQIEDDTSDDDNKGESPSRKEIEEEPGTIEITPSNISKWRKVLQNPTSKTDCLVAIKSIIKSFRKAANQNTDSSDNVKTTNIINPSLFNSIVNAALIDLLPALMRYLRLQNFSNDVEINQDNSSGITQNGLIKNRFYDPRSSRNWTRTMSSIKMYLTDLLKMVNSSSNEACISFLRHILDMIPYYNTFPHLLKRVIRYSVVEWSSGEERNRVLSFLILHRIIRNIQYSEHLNKTERQTLINKILRQLYLSYVVASKSTNEITFDKITFLRNSLVELYHLDHSIAYQQAFIFMRQLAISLTKSVDKDKDSLKRILNWKFIHSFFLWSQLIGVTIKRDSNSMFCQLLAPITHIAMGALQMLCSFKFLPYRLHLIKYLAILSAETSFCTGVLKEICHNIRQIIDHKKGNKKLSRKVSNPKKKLSRKQDVMKKSWNSNTNLDVILKLSTEQSTSIEIMEKIIEKHYEIMLYFLQSIAYSIFFPEYVQYFCHTAREMIKVLPSLKSQTMIKQLLSKCDENIKFIIQMRKEKKVYQTCKGLINDCAANKNFEIAIREDPSIKPPLVEFYEQWKTFLSKQSSPSGDQKLIDRELSHDKLKLNSENFLCYEKNEKFESIQDGIGNDVDDMEDYVDEVELTKEQMKDIQAKIEKEDTSIDESIKIRKRKRKSKRKKTRNLNPNLELEGAFDISSDDE